MKSKVILIIFFLVPITAICQDTPVGKFSLVESVSSNFVVEGFHGISGVEYIPDTKEWFFVGDRGEFFQFKNCQKIADFDKTTLIDSGKTNNYYESIRYDATRRAFFFSVENDGFTAVYCTLPELKTFTPHVILKLPLPDTNKGIEAIAISPSGALWIAPEAGWEFETDASNKISHFYRYKDPIKNSDRSQPERFSYKKTRFEGAYENDALGGISEILAIDEDHLLILERGFYKKTKEHIKATLKTVKVDTSAKRLEILEEYTFDFKSIPNLCNIEGMAWGDAEKKTLLIVADDRLGMKPSTNVFKGNTKELDKPTLQNQMIILKRN